MKSPTTRKDRRVYRVLVGPVIGLCCNALVAQSTLELLNVPYGAAIRPMGQAFAVLFFALIAVVAGLPASIWGVCGARGWYRWIAILGIVLNLTPFLLGHRLFHWAVRVNGLILKE